MLNEKAEKIKNVLFEKTEQNLEKYRDFHFGEFIEKPNQCGYFERNTNFDTYNSLTPNWYYKVLR